MWLAPVLVPITGFTAFSVLSLGGLLLFIPSLVISPKLQPRMVALARRRMLYFDCGYDLRGNPDAMECPECGAGVPPMEQEKNEVAGDPGHHDRA